MRTKIICDFDGTVTPVDTTDALLKRFAPPEWEEVEKEWLAGAITSRECMTRQIAMLRVSERDFGAAIDAFDITPGFREFAAFCAESGLDLAIVSDGIDRVIRRVLANHSLSHIPVFANHLTLTDDGYALTFPYAKENCRFGMCKCGVAEGGEAVLIGDSHSDTCIARKATTVYAVRGKPLESFCEKEGIAHISFGDFHDILADMRQRPLIKGCEYEKINR